MENKNLPMLPQSITQIGLPQPMLNKWTELAAKGLFEEEKAHKCLSLSTTNFSRFLATNFDTAINSTASLATINKYLGEESRFNLLEENIAIVNELVPAKNKIGKPLIAVLLNRLCLNYSYLTVSEIIYALSEGLSGQYGDVTWGAIGIADLVGWIDAYDNIRRSKLEEAQKKQHSLHKIDIFGNRYGGKENPFKTIPTAENLALIERLENQSIEKSVGKALGSRLKEKLGTNETEGQVSE